MAELMSDPLFKDTLAEYGIDSEDFEVFFRDDLDLREAHLKEGNLSPEDIFGRKKAEKKEEENKTEEDNKTEEENKTEENKTEEDNKTEEETAEAQPVEEIKEAPQAAKKLSREELAAIYTPQAKAEHEKILSDNHFPIPKDRDDLVVLRTKDYQKKILDENGKEDFTWNDNVSPILMEHYDWLMRYYRFTDASLEENEDDNAPIEKLELNKDYNISIKDADKIGEFQGSNNCYCCSGTMLYNVFVSKLKGDQKPRKRVNQYQMREAKPLIRKYKAEYENLVEHETYKDYVMEIDSYQGEGKMATGSVFQMGDFLFDKLEKEGITNAALGKMSFRVPNNTSTEKKSTKTNNMRAAFADKIAAIVSDGGVADVLEIDGLKAHYLTVIGIKGDMIEYVDSNSAENYKTSKLTHINNFIKNACSYEVNWLTTVNDPEELKKDYSNLLYSPETGYSVKADSPETVMNVAHTKGITVKKR